jgi:two-component system KDP operon response regulator KdpE
LNLARTVNPDVVLLDVLMVPIGGFEVLDRLRTFSAVPVIMFTARSYIADQATRFGANGFIAKPFRPQQLLDKIEGALNDSRRGSTQ